MKSFRACWIAGAGLIGLCGIGCFWGESASAAPPSRVNMVGIPVLPTGAPARPWIILTPSAPGMGGVSVARSPSSDPCVIAASVIDEKFVVAAPNIDDRIAVAPRVVGLPRVR